MVWRVQTLNAAVDLEISALPEDMRARLVWISQLIAEFGLSRLREPYVKHVAGKLWEIRLSGKSGIARAIYVTALGERVVILHAFVKKTQTTPARAVALATARAKEAKLL